jgi:alkanesulfonate monooxygenase SsuD/methylene tetrahydromethanopterin reductase-like flavin-dependent oxidoreductase (luciferase family)
MHMDIGIIDHIDRQDRPIHETFDDRLKQLQRFDEAGMYAYHLTEHHFTQHGLAPAPITFLAAAARLTKTIRLVPTVFVLPTYHPLRLAEEICMLDHLSHGRFEFGVGRGVVPHELSLWGINPFEAPEIARESYEILMQALTTGKVNFKGDYYRLFKVPMELMPLQKPHPPIWVTSATVEAAHEAGRNGHNMIYLKKAGECRELIDAFMQGREEAPQTTQPMPKLGLTRHLYVAESQAEAEERGMFGFRGWFASHSAIWKRYDSARGWGDEGRYTKSNSLIFGTPDTVAAEIERQFEEAGGGLNYFVPRFSFGDLTHEECMRSFDLFCREVMPRLQRPRAAAQ